MAKSEGGNTNTFHIEFDLCDLWLMGNGKGLEVFKLRHEIKFEFYI